MLASAFGIHGQHITRKDEVEAALDTMLNSDGPYLLHVSIDELENVWRWCRWLSNSENVGELSVGNLSGQCIGWHKSKTDVFYAWCVIVVSTSAQ